MGKKIKYGNQRIQYGKSYRFYKAKQIYTFYLSDVSPEGLIFQYVIIYSEDEGIFYKGTLIKNQRAQGIQYYKLTEKAKSCQVVKKKQSELKLIINQNINKRGILTEGQISKIEEICSLLISYQVKKLQGSFSSMFFDGMLYYPDGKKNRKDLFSLYGENVKYNVQFNLKCQIYYQQTEILQYEGIQNYKEGQVFGDYQGRLYYNCLDSKNRPMLKFEGQFYQSQMKKGCYYYFNHQDGYKYFSGKMKKKLPYEGTIYADLYKITGIFNKDGLPLSACHKFWFDSSSPHKRIPIKIGWMYQDKTIGPTIQWDRENNKIYYVDQREKIPRKQISVNSLSTSSFYIPFEQNCQENLLKLHQYYIKNKDFPRKTLFQKGKQIYNLLIKK